MQFFSTDPTPETKTPIPTLWLTWGLDSTPCYQPLAIPAAINTEPRLLAYLRAICLSAVARAIAIKNHPFHVALTDTADLYRSPLTGQHRGRPRTRPRFDPETIARLTPEQRAQMLPPRWARAATGAAASPAYVHMRDTAPVIQVTGRPEASTIAMEWTLRRAPITPTSTPDRMLKHYEMALFDFHTADPATVPAHAPTHTPEFIPDNDDPRLIDAENYITKGAKNWLSNRGMPKDLRQTAR